MPCTYTGSLEGDALLSAREELDSRERMLCALTRQLERQFGPAETKKILEQAGREAEGLNAGSLPKWWARHREADRRAGR